MIRTFLVPFMQIQPIQRAMGFLFLLLATTAGAQQGGAVPQRIASVNICIDQLLWQLVPRERLVSISYLTASPLWSPISREVRGMHLNHGLAEELVPLQPDLILAAEFDAQGALGLLQKLQLRVARLPVPRTLGDIREQIRQLALLVGAPEAAQPLVDHIDQQLAALQLLAKHQTPRTAFWYSANGIVIGAGTLEHELMQLAGLRNLAAERGMSGFNQLDLELLLSAKPQFIIVEESPDSAYSLAREYLRHPALAQADLHILRLPAGLSGCAASVIGDVAALLQQQLAALPAD